MTSYTFTLNNVTFTIPNITFTIPHDLGPGLNSEITNFYAHFLTGKPFDSSHFNSVVIAYFNSNVDHYQAHDSFFTDLSTPWSIFKESGRFLDARRVWETALYPAQQWEQANSPHAIHKGTPYYFLAVTAILSGDLDLGFLLMHQALVEDNRATGKPLPDTPASALITLNHQKSNQYFRKEVLDTANFLDGFLTNYRNKSGNSLTLDEFRSRLFKVTELKDSFFLLVFTLFKFKGLIRKIDSRFRTNSFAGLIEIGALVDLCLVIDSVINHKNTSKPKGKNKKGNTYIDHMKFLSDSCVFSLDYDRLIEINTAFNNKRFSVVIVDLLNGTWTFKDGTNMSPSEIDLALSYGIRNFSAHNIESIPAIYENIEDIFQRVINVLFLSVEKLY